MDVKSAFRRVRLGLRFIAPLTIALALLALALVPLVDELMLETAGLYGGVDQKAACAPGLRTPFSRIAGTA